MNEFFFSALSFGLAAGLKPGPLGIVVIQQTLSRGLRSGLRASMAPLITDGPIIIAALWFLSQFKSIDLFAAHSVFWWPVPALAVTEDVSCSKYLYIVQVGFDASLGTAVKVNLLNPGPYLFWFTVGGSYIVRGTTTESLVFVVTAIGTLIASKIAVALLAANFLPSLESRGYLATMKVLAALLAVFGLLSLPPPTNWWRPMREISNLRSTGPARSRAPRALLPEKFFTLGGIALLDKHLWHSRKTNVS